MAGASAVALVREVPNEKEKDVIREERGDKENILRGVRDLRLTHELERHRDVVQRDDKNDVDEHIRRAGG